MASTCPSSLRLAIMGLLLLVLAPSVSRAGAVFEIREDVINNATLFKFIFGSPASQLNDFPGSGSIRRSGGDGAGLKFKASAIPLAIFALERCAALGIHVHPNSAETLFVLKGSIKVYMFRGEEDLAVVRSFDLGENQAGYIPQGTYHFVENTFAQKTKFLQIFDHPFGGAVFAAPAIVALRNAGGNAAAIVNAQFNKVIIDQFVSAKPPMFQVPGCNW